MRETFISVRRHLFLFKAQSPHSLLTHSKLLNFTRRRRGKGIPEENIFWDLEGRDLKRKKVKRFSTNPFVNQERLRMSLI